MSEDKFDGEDVDFYGEFKERMRQEPLNSVLDRRAKSSSPIGGIISVFLGIFLTSLLIWYAIERFSSQETEIVMDDSLVPVVKAKEEPAKVKPENIGGMEIPGRDKHVYGRIGKSLQEEPEKILQKTEHPTSVATNEENHVQEVNEAMVPDIKEKAKDSEVEPSTPAAMVKITRPVPEQEPVPIYQPGEEDIAPNVTTETATQKALPATGEWKVQVLSSKQKNLVEKAWDDMKKKNPELLAGVSHEIMEADLGSKGVFFRLRVGNFANKADADALCKNLKSKKYDCIVVK